MLILASDTLICVLPNPQWNDSRTPQSNVDIKRFKDGGYSVFTNTLDLVELSFTFGLTDEKGREFQEFYESNAGKRLTLIWGDDSYVGIILTEPGSLSSERRSSDACVSEGVALSLNFVGKQ